MNVALVVARAGSKSLVGKNTFPILGVPAVVYSFAAAKGASCVDEVWISTDCEECKRLARREGVTVIDRPDWLATDEAPVGAVWLHAMAMLEDRGVVFETVTSLQGDCPIRECDLLDRCFGEHLRIGLPCMTCQTSTIMVPAWEFTPRDDGTYQAPQTYWGKESYDHRLNGRAVYPAGACIVFNKDAARKSILAGGHLGDYYALAPIAPAIDIHSEEDVAMAEGLLRRWPDRYVTWGSVA